MSIFTDKIGARFFLNFSSKNRVLVGLIMTRITIINLVVRHHGSCYAPQGEGLLPLMA